MLKKIRRAAVKIMRNYNLISKIQNSAKRQSSLIIETENAKKQFINGEISIQKLHKIASFEKLAMRIEFCGCMNVAESKIESGLLVKIDGNWDYLTKGINYLGNSIVSVYKTRYYLADGTNFKVQKIRESFDWTSEKINKLFDLELIKILLDNLHGKKRRELVSLMKYLLSVRYHGLSFEQLINEIND